MSDFPQTRRRRVFLFSLSTSIIALNVNPPLAGALLYK
ncbi:hypothetical protein BN132_220 [Cronobacter turicensis 564]|nr:hypothetical protein BN132_220 [Cronobacter turicensis 564]